MTDDTPRHDDQSKGSSGVSISRRHVLMTSTVLAASVWPRHYDECRRAAQTIDREYCRGGADRGAKKPNIVMLMTDDTGWGDFGCYGGGAALGHPTPNIDRLAKEGAVFTSWYGQASCTAGRASFMTGRIPIRSALSVVVVPGDPNGLHEGHADHRRVLPEERLHDLFLRQMASGRQARSSTRSSTASTR